MSLTPNHLLFGWKFSLVSEIISDNVNKSPDVNLRASKLNLILNQFWDRWRRE